MSEALVSAAESNRDVQNDNHRAMSLRFLRWISIESETTCWGRVILKACFTWTRHTSCQEFQDIERAEFSHLLFLNIVFPIVTSSVT